MHLLCRVNIQFGNHKLPKTTAIFNICSAHECPSRARGLCQVINAGHRCYALRDEQRYPGPLGYRRNQERVWDALTAEEFATDFVAIMGRRRTSTTAIRFNESGDFRSQSDVDKAAEIARLLKPRGVTVYCYTARRDLDFSAASPMVVNGSGFRVHGEFRFIHTKAERPKNYGLCQGSCGECGRCIRGALTCVLPH